MVKEEGELRVRDARLLEVFAVIDEYMNKLVKIVNAGAVGASKGVNTINRRGWNNLHDQYERELSEARKTLRRAMVYLDRARRRAKSSEFMTKLRSRDNFVLLSFEMVQAFIEQEERLKDLDNLKVRMQLLVKHFEKALDDLKGATHSLEEERDDLPEEGLEQARLRDASIINYFAGLLELAEKLSKVKSWQIVSIRTNDAKRKLSENFQRMEESIGVLERIRFGADKERRDIAA